MAIVTKTPGVYIEEVSLFPPSVAAVDTAVPAFIGYTDMLPDSIQAVKVRTLLDFEQNFCNWEIWKLKYNIQDRTADEKFSQNQLYYNIQLYFANGGGKCYVIALGPKKAGGAEKQDFLDALKVLETEDEPTLIVAPEAVQLPYADYIDYNQQALAQAAKLMDRFVLIDIPEAEKGDIETFRGSIGTNNLKYGAVYYPHLQTSIGKYTPLDDDDIVLTESAAPVPASAPAPAATAGEVPTEKKPKPAATIRMESGSIVRQQALVRLKSETLVLPPSAAIAGVYAAVDAARGVWKAPANVSLNAVSGLTRKISHEEQAELNIHAEGGKSINAIRAFSGQGILVWGARTLAGNDNEWKYVNVRRFYNFVEESVMKATQVFVFEPNDANTWVRISTMIENFLSNLWRQGALAGATPKEAFYVRIGLGVTMSAEDILNGLLNVEIGLAVVRPAEYLVLRFAHKMQES